MSTFDTDPFTSTQKTTGTLEPMLGESGARQSKTSVSWFPGLATRVAKQKSKQITRRTKISGQRGCPKIGQPVCDVFFFFLGNRILAVLGGNAPNKSASILKGKDLASPKMNSVAFKPTTAMSTKQIQQSGLPPDWLGRKK